jgi:hypothetical protein
MATGGSLLNQETIIKAFQDHDVQATDFKNLSNFINWQNFNDKYDGPGVATRLKCLPTMGGMSCILITSSDICEP